MDRVAPNKSGGVDCGKSGDGGAIGVENMTVDTAHGERGRVHGA
jgi:hypothetical protein